MLLHLRSYLPARYGRLRWHTILTRPGAARFFSPQTNVNEEELAAARAWLAYVTPETIPRSICALSFSRSSGPGGQKVNKTSSKATLRISASDLFAYVPRLLQRPLQQSQYYAPRDGGYLVIHADEARKQGTNVTKCFRKLHQLLLEAGKSVVPNETTPEQMIRVEQLQKEEAAGRRRLKESQSRKKSARRMGRGDD